jgi:hypothetical protein
MIYTIAGAGAVVAGARAALRYGSGSDKKMRLLAALAPALQHWPKLLKPEPHRVIAPAQQRI